MIDLKKCGKINKSQLRIGTKIEMEHTKSKRVASKIASQHICEFPTYYSALINMESKLKRGVR